MSYIRQSISTIPILQSIAMASEQRSPSNSVSHVAASLHSPHSHIGNTLSHQLDQRLFCTLLVLLHCAFTLLQHSSIAFSCGLYVGKNC